MVRGNWQKRVEIASARRIESKQRKQLVQENKNYKLWMIEFIQLLDKHSKTIINLNNSRNNNSNNNVLHIWSTTFPSDDASSSQSLLDLLTTPSTSTTTTTTKKRSGSMEELHGSTSGGGRDVGKGSRSNTKKTNKKKPHPRSSSKDSYNNDSIPTSNNELNQQQQQQQIPNILACRSDFFQNTCPHNNKGINNNCPHLHYNTIKHPTMSSLAQVILPFKKKQQQQQHSEQLHQEINQTRRILEVAETALVESQSSSSSSSSISSGNHHQDLVHSGSGSGGMELLYHISISINELISLISTTTTTTTTTATTDEVEKDDGPTTTTTTTTKIGQLLSRQFLAMKHKIPMASIVYIVYNTTLIYDRYQEGGILKLVSDDQQQFILEQVVMNNNNNNNNNIINHNSIHDNEKEQQQEEEEEELQEEERRRNRVSLSLLLLPGSILDYIVTYLSDSAVAITSQVCKHWYNEIGNTTPYLWNYLLQRRNWPLSSSSSLSSLSTTTTDIDDTNAAVPSNSTTINIQTTTTMATATSPATTTAATKTTTTTLRDVFLGHYAAMRDLAGLQAAMTTMIKTSSSSSSSSSLMTIPRGFTPSTTTTTTTTSTIGELVPTWTNNPDMVQYDFSKLNHHQHSLPQWPNVCISIHVWSSHRIVAVYNHDCSVRLFEVIPISTVTGVGGSSSSSNSNDTNERRRCKELICQYFDPYRFTKKRNCEILCMEIDDICIGCLCQVTTTTTTTTTTTRTSDDDNEGRYNILIVMSREEFLLGESSSSSSSSKTSKTTTSATTTTTRSPTDNLWMEVNIGEAFMNYILTCGDDDEDIMMLDDRMKELYDFLIDENDEENVNGSSWNDLKPLKKVQVNASPSMVNCGNGRFMVEVTIWIPTNPYGNIAQGEAEEYGERTYTLLDKKLILFSTTSTQLGDVSGGGGAIIWIGDSDPMEEGPRIRHYGITLSSLRQRSSSSSSSRPSSTIVIANQTSPILLVCEIDSSGYVIQPPKRLDMAETVWNEHLPNGWERRGGGGLGSPFCGRPVLVTPNDIITGDNLVRMENNEISGRRCVISFLPRQFLSSSSSSSEDNEATTGSLPIRTLLLEDMEIIRMGSLRDDHVMVFCRSHRRQSPQQPQVGGGGDDDDDDIQGEWFGVVDGLNNNNGNNEMPQQQPAPPQISVYGIVIHAKTGQEIARACLVKNVLDISDVPRITSTVVSPDHEDYGLVGFGFSCHGVVMTGQNVRTVTSSSLMHGNGGGGDTIPTSKSAGKKKKGKARSKKGGKKDGFARGQSLRG